MSAPHTLRLGVIGMESSLGPVLEAILVAAQYVNNNATILPNVRIEIHTSPYTAVETENLFNALYHAEELQVQGIIGALTSQMSKVVQQIARLYSIPQISSNAITSTFNDKSLYPTFMRTLSADLSQIEAIVSFFQECGWKKGVVVYTPDEYGLGYANLAIAAARRNITLVAFAGPTFPTHSDNYTSVMETVKERADVDGYRIIILYISVPTFTGYAVQAMKLAGLVSSDHVTIVTGSAPDAFNDPDNFMYNHPGLDGAFGVAAGFPYGPEFETILRYWRTLNITQWPGYYAVPFYTVDIVLAYAYAVDNLMSAGVPFEDIKEGVLLRQLINQTFEGTTGEVVMDSRGNRLGSYELYNWHRTQAMTHVGSYSVIEQKYTKLLDYTFFGGRTSIPPDSPFTCAACVHGKCVVNVGCVCDKEYSGTACDVKEASKTAMLPWLIPVLVVILASLVGAYFYYKKKRSALVREVAEKQRSQIARSDLTLLDRVGRGASGEVCKAQFRGTDVAVKKIVTSHVSKDVIEEFELEVAIMCGLRHPNIILFMGSCYDPSSNEMLLVMEFMSRGSLSDVLNNPKIPIAYDMKLSLACQAAQGMNFLHQSTPPLVHRDLKSHNILIDDKWNARISDFGITKFKDDTRKARNANANANREKSRSIGTIYWTAPEALQGDAKITEKCDCYSFGIVLWEIFHRQNPYTGRDPMSVAVDVINKGLRPAITADIPSELQELMEACWAQQAEDRPSFQVIMTTLRKLSPMRTTTTPVETGSRVDAPTGHVYLVSTMVDKPYTLWDAMPRAMEEAMKIHIQIVRTHIEKYNGYEASLVDHSFTSAFGNLEDAMNFCAATQIALLNAEWPSELLSHPLTKAIYEGGILQWVGLRVKMSVCSGVPNCEIDNTSGRMKYMGPVVEKSKQLLGIAGGGYILVSDPVAGEIGRKSLHLIHEISTHKIGDVKLNNSARNKTEDVHEVSIKLLRRKLSASALKQQEALPHAIISVMDYEETPLPPSPTTKGALTIGNISDVTTVSWVTTKTDIASKEPIGKGAIGDYFRGQWKGKEVALKVLVNQKLKEDDIFKLIGDSAYMSKLNHPNLLPFHAVCLESNYITVVSEYEAKGNLKLLLADSSVSLPWARKVKIALDLAHGLSYLTSLPDATLQMHDNLKSNNVLIGKDWEVKIADYGHGNIRELARTMTSVGNVAWTAPEILNGNTATPKIAQYSYGVILWELLTRQIPYQNEHPIRVVTRILGGYRPTIPSDCPAPYKQIIEGCWDAEPENRPSWGTIISTLSSVN